MIIIKGKHNVAQVMLNDENYLDQETRSQIQNMVNHPAFGDSTIRIMPDCHAGKGSVIGFTMTCNNYVIPNVVGVDIGCGVTATTFSTMGRTINLAALDEYIKKNIPSGFSVRNTPDGEAVMALRKGLGKDKFEAVSKRVGSDLDRDMCSLGTLGGGNHFIELGMKDDEYVLTVHSGSRNFGMKVATFWQNCAKEYMKAIFHGDTYKDLEFLIRDEISGKSYVLDSLFATYYASINRTTIIRSIMKGIEEMIDVPVDRAVQLSSIHNYVGDDDIIRKGAIAAREGVKVIIPLNMRDGSIIAVGKGNKEWNYSAPHGAGRVMSRAMAKEYLKLDEYKESMEGIYSSCINLATIDECPYVYKDKDLILSLIPQTLDIISIVKPIYNFKAGGE